MAGHDECPGAGLPFRGMGSRLRVSAARSKAEMTARRASANESSATMPTSLHLHFRQHRGKVARCRRSKRAGGFARQGPCHQGQNIDRTQAHLVGQEPGDAGTMVVGGGRPTAKAGREAPGGELIV